MAITISEWLITSDVACEAGFRVDVPEPGRGRWVLSYAPTGMRFSQEQALAGVVLAELIMLELFGAGGEFDSEMAVLHAGVLGIPLTDVMCLLALRCAGGEDSPQAAGVGEASG